MSSKLLLCMVTSLFVLASCISDNDETIALKENPRKSAYTSYLNERGQLTFVYNTTEGRDAYVITNNDGVIEKLNLVFSLGNTTEYGTIFLYNNAVRSITLKDVTYIFHQNKEGKIDVAVTSHGYTDLYTNVGDASRITYADGTDISQVFAAIAGAVDIIKGTNTMVDYDSDLFAYITDIINLLNNVNDGSAEFSDSEVSGSLQENAEEEEDPEDLDMSGIDQNETNAETNTDIGNGAIASGIGALKVTLTWKYSADIDLHVYEPGCRTPIPSHSSETGHIYFSNKNGSFTDGYLDIDNTVGYYINPLTGERNTRLSAVENVYWNDNPKDGTFYVYLHYYGGSQSGPCTVTIYKNGKTLLTKTVDMSSADNSVQRFIASVSMPQGTISMNRSVEVRDGMFDYWALPAKE